jgi:hypothetical protein
MATEPVRIDVHEAKARMETAFPPLLVLAYEDDKKFPMYRLGGAIPFSEFQSSLNSLPKDREIIFY